MLPKNLRDIGFATQKEVLIACMPYMEWIAASDLRKKFNKLFPGENKDQYIKWAIDDFKKRGYIEMKTGGIPDTSKRTGGLLAPNPYSYYRRIVKSIPRTAASERRKDGTFGDKKIIAEAKKNKGVQRKPHKTSVKNLSLEDYFYIQRTAGEITNKAAGQMFNVHIDLIVKIRKGYRPNHLRAQLARLQF